LYQVRIESRSSWSTAGMPAMACHALIGAFNVAKSLSIRPFCHGQPGVVRWWRTPRNAIARRNRNEVNVASLSVRTALGAPYRSIASSSTRRIAIVDFVRSSRSARHARVPWSMRPRIGVGFRSLSGR
jgi:hypothetical protein